jgi:hypothetical protein
VRNCRFLNSRSLAAAVAAAAADLSVLAQLSLGGGRRFGFGRPLTAAALRRLEET